MLPARSLSTAQLVPNWKLITIPDTTPMPNDTAKIFIQKKYRSRHSESRVRSQRHSRKASQCARPMVNAGNRMWNEITNANCTRDRNSGDSRRSSTRLDSTARGNAAVRIVRPRRDGRKKGRRHPLLQERRKPRAFAVAVAPPPAKAGGGWEGVATVCPDPKDTPPQPSPAFAGEGAIAR